MYGGEGETGKMHLSQKKYVEELLEKFDMKHAKTVSTPIDPNLKITKEMCPTMEDERQEMKNRPYRELIGGLIYLQGNLANSKILILMKYYYLYTNIIIYTQVGGDK